MANAMVAVREIKMDVDRAEWRALLKGPVYRVEMLVYQRVREKVAELESYRGSQMAASTEFQPG